MHDAEKIFIPDYSNQNTTQLFNSIMEQYIKNVAKVTSIDSIFISIKSSFFNS